MRHTIRTKCLIEAGDNVLVALSGGSSSLALLLLLQEICESKQQAARHGQVGSTLLAGLLHIILHLVKLHSSYAKERFAFLKRDFTSDCFPSML